MSNNALPLPPNRQAVILVVDDNPEVIRLLNDVLLPEFRVRLAQTGQAALAIAQTEPKPDLILLDVLLPQMDGYEVLARLREQDQTRDIPVVFITALDGDEEVVRGLELGAADYITKPLCPAIVLARVHTQIELKRSRDWLRNQNVLLEAEVARRTEESQLIEDVSIFTLARLAEVRDEVTGNHLRRTQHYIRVLAESLCTHPRFAAFLTAANIETLTKSALLHDIGKIGIPDHILLKPGKLTPVEREIMQTHAKLGRDAIELAKRDAAKPVEFLSMAQEIAHYHHEKWDGSGYPEGLAGDTIPIPARLMALADVFDALICNRQYKKPWTFEEAKELILQERGGHFDPDVVDAFISRFDEFTAIADRYADQCLMRDTEIIFSVGDSSPKA